MSNLLSIAISGLNAAKAGLTVTSNNLANVSTSGYTEEVVLQNESATETTGDGYSMGTGVTVTGVGRETNQYLTAAVWSANSSNEAATTYDDLATTLNDALSGSGDLETVLDDFYAGFTSISSDPTDTSVREAALGDASSVATTYNTLAEQLDDQSTSINQQISGAVTSINNLTSQIATLNTAIAAENGSSSSSSDSLLDERDSLVQELAGYVGITTSTNSDGSLSIATQSGQTLVSEGQSYALGVSSNVYDASQNDVTNSAGIDISSQLSGGTLGALISYRSNVLSTAENMLGLSAIGLASSVNSQQAAGLDLDGDQGSDIFSVASPAVMAASTNAGSATVSASITSTSGLTSSNYILSYDDGAWNLETTGGESVAMTENSDGSYSAAGMTFSISGSASDGDSYLIEPTADAASSLTVSMTDPDGIAAATAVAASAGSGNAGTAAVSAVTVTDSSNADLLDTVSVTFTSASQYEILGSDDSVIATGTYTAGSGISADGWTLSLSGTPSAGDSFTVSANTTGLSDNSNALSLAALADSKVLSSGSATVVDSVSSLTTYIGNIGSQAATNSTTQTALYNNAVEAQQSVSGVSEDEEASNLVMYQQAYEASAEVISAAQTIFNSLITAIQA
ncbi:flagellar hook-associated protein FlgK [Frateuria aurantia]